MKTRTHPHVMRSMFSDVKYERLINVSSTEDFIITLLRLVRNVTCCLGKLAFCVFFTQLVKICKEFFAHNQVYLVELYCEKSLRTVSQTCQLLLFDYCLFDCMVFID